MDAFFVSKGTKKENKHIINEYQSIYLSFLQLKKKIIIFQALCTKFRFLQFNK